MRVSQHAHPAPPSRDSARDRRRREREREDRRPCESGLTTAFRIGAVAALVSAVVALAVAPWWSARAPAWPSSRS